MYKSGSGVLYTDFEEYLEMHGLDNQEYDEPERACSVCGESDEDEVIEYDGQMMCFGCLDEDVTTDESIEEYGMEFIEENSEKFLEWLAATEDWKELKSQFIREEVRRDYIKFISEVCR